MIAFALGPDAATARANGNNLAHAFDPDGSHTVHLDGRAVTARDVVREVASVGFFDAKRQVMVDNLVTRYLRASPDDDENVGDEDSSSASDDLAQLIRSVPVEHHLIFIEPSLSSVPASLRRLLPAGTEIILGAPPRGNELLAWMTERALEARSSLGRSTARLLADKTYPGTWSAAPRNPRYDRPPDLDHLAQEIEKLALFAHPEPITDRHVDAIVSSGSNDPVFPFLGAVERGDLRRSLADLTELDRNGIEHGRMTAQLLQQGELTVLIDAGSNHDAAAIGRAAGLSNPARMSGIANGRRQRSLPDAARQIARWLYIERQTKRGVLRDSTDTLYQLMTASTRPPGGG